MDADTHLSSHLANCLWMNRQVKSLQRKVGMEVNKYIFEVRDMNKQKLSEVQREKKEEKRNSGPFPNKRRERNQTKERMGEGGKELMNAGILTLHCRGISRSKQASPD